MNINIIIIKDVNYKIIAKEKIKKGEIILVEKPIYKEPDTIKLLYEILRNKDDIHIISLYPREYMNLNNSYLINLMKLINNYNNHKIRKFLLLIDIKTLYFYYSKILFNAFQMNNNACVLPIGAMMNHSCSPNIIFYEKNNTMIFEALTNINKNDELCYSYLRNYKYTNNKDKQLYLLNHYNFICQCSLCI
jgi:SET domain-containing protein